MKPSQFMVYPSIRELKLLEIFLFTNSIPSYRRFLLERRLNDSFVVIATGGSRKDGSEFKGRGGGRGEGGSKVRAWFIKVQCRILRVFKVTFEA